MAETVKKKRRRKKATDNSHRKIEDMHRKK